LVASKKYDTAREEIDLPTYVLTDWLKMQVLARAADLGVKAMIYLDGTWLAQGEPAKA